MSNIVRSFDNICSCVAMANSPTKAGTVAISILCSSNVIISDTAKVTLLSCMLLSLDHLK